MLRHNTYDQRVRTHAIIHSKRLPTSIYRASITINIMGQTIVQGRQCGLFLPLIADVRKTVERCDTWRCVRKRNYFRKIHDTTERFKSNVGTQHMSSSENHQLPNIKTLQNGIYRASNATRPSGEKEHKSARTTTS